jgi:hypothetical protein
MALEAPPVREEQLAPQGRFASAGGHASADLHASERGATVMTVLGEPLVPETIVSEARGGTIVLLGVSTQWPLATLVESKVLLPKLVLPLPHLPLLSVLI